MPKITYVKPDGTRQVIEAEVGRTVMEIAVQHGVSGIVGECGGCCQCATCHLYVSEEWRERLPPIGELEEAMLENTLAERCHDSRLGCQIKIKAEYDGLTVRVPGRQI
jgi:ferredoxin, 2Fe-2S